MLISSRQGLAPSRPRAQAARGILGTCFWLCSSTWCLGSAAPGLAGGEHVTWWGGCEGKGPFGCALAASHPQLAPCAWRGRAGLSPSTFPAKKQPPCTHACEQIDLKWCLSAIDHLLISSRYSARK